MNVADLVKIYFERAVAIQNYWTVYILVIGGILAFSTFRPNRNVGKTAVLTLLYVCFAYRNCGAIVETIGQRDAAREAALTAPSNEAAGPVLATMTGTSPSGATNFHLICDVLTVAAIWVMELRRKD